MSELARAAVNAAATIHGIYAWIDRINAAGGATSLEGVAACHSMLESLNSNRKRIDKEIIEPLEAALANPDEGA